MQKIRQLQAGESIKESWIARLVRKVNGHDISVTEPLSVQHTDGGTTISLKKSPTYGQVGVIVANGPSGEADFSGVNKYWVQKIDISGDVFLPNTYDENNIVEAISINEYSNPGVLYGSGRYISSGTYVTLERHIDQLEGRYKWTIDDKRTNNVEFGITTESFSGTGSVNSGTNTISMNACSEDGTIIGGPLKVYISMPESNATKNVIIEQGEIRPFVRYACTHDVNIDGILLGVVGTGEILPNGTTSGDILIYNGEKWEVLAPPTDQSVYLGMNSTGKIDYTHITLH